MLLRILVAASVVGMPIATIWSLNVLFGLTIPLTLKTWAAALILGGIASGAATRINK